jgi:hypothetical protein
MKILNELLFNFLQAVFINWGKMLDTGNFTFTEFLNIVHLPGFYFIHTVLGIWLSPSSAESLLSWIQWTELMPSSGDGITSIDWAQMSTLLAEGQNPVPEIFYIT